MSYLNEVQKKIAELEKRIREGESNYEKLKEELNSLRKIEFEEDLRESDNRRLLQE